jgi:hypothetical protein
LVRISIFAAAAVAALSVFALVRAAPADTAARPAYQLAALNRSASGDDLQDDAAAAGETAVAPPSAAGPLPPTAQSEDPIGAMIAAEPPPAPAAGPDVDQAQRPFDLPYPRTHARRPAHRRAVRPVRHRPELAGAPHAPPVAARPPARRPHPQPQVQPHQLHIIVRPAPHPALAPAATPPPVDAALPEVQAEQAPLLGRDAQLAVLTQAADADMGASRLALSPDLSLGREGTVAVRLPAGLLGDLEARAAASGFDLQGDPVVVTVTLSAQGYGLSPAEAETAQLAEGQPAVFSWQASPSGAAGGALSAAMTASVQLNGEAVSFPLGVLTAEVPPLAQPAPAAAPVPEPVPSLGARIRAGLERLGLPELARLKLHDLAIPGRPTLDVPLLGQTPSQNVVAAGLLILALLFLRSLLQGSSIRAERRRRFAAFERGDFGEEFH